MYYILRRGTGVKYTLVCGIEFVDDDFFQLDKNEIREILAEECGVNTCVLFAHLHETFLDNIKTKEIQVIEVCTLSITMNNIQ